MLSANTQEWTASGVKNTCISSLKSKLSSILGGYLSIEGKPIQLSDSSFFQYFVNEPCKKPPRRSALINRGYSIRQFAIDWVMDHLANDIPIQIVNLGCGLDPLYFRFKTLMNSCYFLEIDFPDVVKRKIATITSTLLYNLLEDTIIIKEETRLITTSYGCISADLTCPETLIDDIEYLVPNFLKNRPTLFISECVLSYLPADKADNLLSLISKQFNFAYFLLYEQIIPIMDSFSVKMLKHFQTIQSPLISIEQGYRNLSDHYKRFYTLGYKKAEGVSLDDFFRNIDKEFKLSSHWSKLEPFDEIEEWDIKICHYMIFIASNTEYCHSGLDLSMKKLKSFNSSNKSFKIAKTPILEYEPIYKQLFQHKRWGHVSVLFNSSIVVIFGGNGLSFNDGSSQGNIKRQNDSLLINIDSRKSLLCNSIINPSPRIHHRIVPYSSDSHGDYEIFLFGGRHSPEYPLDDAWIGRLSSNESESKQYANMSWIEIPHTSHWPVARYRHAMTLLKRQDGDFVIISGGLDGNGNTLNDIWIFYKHKWYLIDIIVDQDHDIPNTWSKELCKRHSHTIHCYKDTLLLVGGQCSHQFTDILMISLSSIFDHPWRIVKCITLKPQMLIYGHNSHLLLNDKYLLIVGGYQKNINGNSLQSRALMVSLEDNSNIGYVTDVSGIVLGQNSMSLIHCSSIYSEPKDELWIFGGGFTCFSMGSYFDSTGLCIPRLKHRLFISDILDLNVNVGNFTMKHVPIIAYGNDSYNKYLFREPFLIRRISFGPLSTEWTWKDLEHSCPADMKISVHVSSNPSLAFHQRNFEYRTMAWNDFITCLFNSNNNSIYYYMRAVDGRNSATDLEKNFPAISKAFIFPEHLIPDIKKKTFSSVLRISSPSVQLWTHYDVLDNILCQVWGTKRVILWPPSDLSKLSIKGSSTTSTGHPILDHDQLYYSDLHPIVCDMYPGDILYIPSCWFHHVTAGNEEPSLAINIFWKEESESLYDTKDLFGNRDLIPFTRATDKLAATIKEMIKELPERYMEFYIDKLQLFINEFKNKH